MSKLRYAVESFSEIKKSTDFVTFQRCFQPDKNRTSWSVTLPRCLGLRSITWTGRMGFCAECIDVRRT